MVAFVRDKELLCRPKPSIVYRLSHTRFANENERCLFSQLKLYRRRNATPFMDGTLASNSLAILCISKPISIEPSSLSFIARMRIFYNEICSVLWTSEPHTLGSRHTVHMRAMHNVKSMNWKSWNRLRRHHFYNQILDSV